MRLADYLKDHIAAYIIKAVALAICIIFMSAFKADIQAIIVVSFVFAMAAFLLDLWEYLRKKAFYSGVKFSLNELDKKYLLPELLEEPGFCEGRILLDTLRDCDKSMTENVAYYRRQSNAFREYIEMWVHEVKIPVSSLRIMCHNNPETNKKMIGEIKRIDDYIENVLYYARSENAEKDYLISEVFLQKAFGNVAVKNRETLQIMDATIEAKDLNVPVLTDGKWLEYMIGQLMANSIKYSSTDRNLIISAYAKENNDAVTFYFKDNGIGIPKEDMAYVFEKSFTGHNGREDRKSTGMGLYIVKNLCERLGHSIEISSEVGEYTEVRIVFSKNDFYKMK